MAKFSVILLTVIFGWAIVALCSAAPSSDAEAVVEVHHDADAVFPEEKEALVAEVAASDEAQAEEVDPKPPKVKAGTPAKPTTKKPAAAVTTKKPAAAVTTKKPAAPATTKKPAAAVTTKKPTAAVTTKKPTTNGSHSMQLAWTNLFFSFIALGFFWLKH